MANDQKAEDLLNLALDTPYEMRERSKQLDVGYDRENRTWELIVKYSGNLKEQLLGLPGVEVVETYENFEETPQNMKDEKLERLAAELVKHKTSVYKKYLKE